MFRSSDYIRLYIFRTSLFRASLVQSSDSATILNRKRILKEEIKKKKRKLLFRTTYCHQNVVHAFTMQLVDEFR